MKKLIVLTISLIMVSTAMGQSVSKQINDIKRSKQYITAEATMETEEQAYALAEELLAQSISEYVADKKSLKQAANVIVKDVAGKAEKLQMKRGEMARVFLYVKKSDIIAADNTRVLVQPNNTAGKDAGKKKDKEKSKAAKTSDSSLELASTVEDIKGDAPSETAADSWQLNAINELLACESLAVAQKKLEDMKIDMQVKRYGVPATCRYPEKCCWLIFDEQQNIVTVLGEGSDSRMNYKTQQADKLSNYKDHGAIWFMLAK